MWCLRKVQPLPLDKKGHHPDVLQSCGISSNDCSEQYELLFQVALSGTQQQLAQQNDIPDSPSGRADQCSISPKRFSALQQNMQDLHADIAELKNTVFQKDAELEMLHR